MRRGEAIRRHVRANVVAYLALVIAMSGTATALQGSNTVTSDDVVNGQIKRPDLSGGAVGSNKIGAEQVTRSDFAPDAVDGSKVATRTLTGARISSASLNSLHIGGLNGTDVLENTLGEVPLATVGGYGRTDWTKNPYGSVCDPNTTGYAVCGTMTMSLPANGRLLILGAGQGGRSSENTTAAGNCALYTSQTGGFGAVRVQVQRHSASRQAGGDFQMSVVTPPIGPGNVNVELHCNQTSGDIYYHYLFVTAVQIGPS